MRLGMHERKALTDQVAFRYRQAKGVEKRKVLDEFVANTGYHRKYAIMLLNGWGKRKAMMIDGEPVLLKSTGRKRRPGGGRKAVYGPETVAALQRVWAFFGCRCGKLLAPFLRGQMVFLVEFKMFGITGEAARQLERLSPATIDRKLKAARDRMRLKGKSLTRTGSSLKNQVPVRVYWPWADRLPGFFETDTVHHCADTSSGDYCLTLTMTDVGSGWVELRALRNKAHKWMHQALDDVRLCLPFPLLGIDSDSGFEFINGAFISWTKGLGIEFTRSRSCHKNDNCFVEQKNDDCVRKYVGYARYETTGQCEALQELYRALCPLLNYFIPTAKLVSKVREGSKIRKIYDGQPVAPYQRLLTSPHLSAEIKRELVHRHGLYNPVQLQVQVYAALRLLAAAHPSRFTPKEGPQETQGLDSLL